MCWRRYGILPESLRPRAKEVEREGDQETNETQMMEQISM
jgi:hypothetical protein